MNTQLYNSLVQAKKFLVAVYNNDKEIRRIEGSINTAGYDPKTPVPTHREKKFNWIIFLVLLFFGLGIPAVVYALYIYSNNQRARQQKKVLDAYHKSPEQIAKRIEINKSVDEQKRALQEKIAESKKFYSDNYWGCMGFLPEWARKFDTTESIVNGIKYIDGLIHYVKHGAQTLDEAMIKYGQELQDIDEMREEAENRKATEKRHKEEMDAMNKIARNQERVIRNQENIYDEVKKIHRGEF